MKKCCCLLLLALLVGVMTACGGPSSTKAGSRGTRAVAALQELPATPKSREAAMVAMGLIGTDYRYGGKSFASGFDCSGLVSYVYKAVGYPLIGNAASMAKRGRRVHAVRPGDLVFFNTTGRAHSHVGVFIGEGRFVHAPSSNGQVRIEELGNPYFRARFEEARAYLE